MSTGNDPHKRAYSDVVAFLVETGIPWSSFEQTFDTLQHVASNSSAVSKSKVVALIRTVYSSFEKTKNNRSGAWEKFYQRVFSQLDVERNLPTGVHWEKFGKSDWRLVKEQTHTDSLGDLLEKTTCNKSGNVWTCVKGHPLLKRNALSTAEVMQLPRVCQRITSAHIELISNETYVVVLALRVPVRKTGQCKELMSTNYIDNNKAEKLVNSLLPKSSAIRIDSTRTRAFTASKMQHVETLTLMLRT